MRRGSYKKILEDCQCSCGGSSARAAAARCAGGVPVVDTGGERGGGGGDPLRSHAEPARSGSRARACTVPA